jgi:hypothetical protein
MTQPPLRVLALSCLLLTAPAFAQQSLADVSTGDSRSSGSSVLTARTVGAGALVFHPEIGYPAVSLSLLYGSTSRFDVGGRFSFGYGSRYGFGLDTGAGAQFVMRFNFLERGIVSFGLRFEPGLLFGFRNNGALTLVAPVGLVLGIHPHPIVNFGLGLDFGFAVAVAYGGGAYFGFPISAGPCVEVNLTRTIALTLDLRFGGGVFGPSNYYGGFGAKAALGLAFKI